MVDEVKVVLLLFPTFPELVTLFTEGGEEEEEEGGGGGEVLLIEVDDVMIEETDVEAGMLLDVTVLLLLLLLLAWLLSFLSWWGRGTFAFEVEVGATFLFWFSGEVDVPFGLICCSVVPLDLICCWAACT